MTINVITQRFPDNRDLFPAWASDTYLGHRVQFQLGGHPFTGTVTETERRYLCNGTHDILTVELDHEPKQVYIQMHRQAVKLIEGGKS
jgi:hypothetical protein